MKFLIASDIHGSSRYCSDLLSAYCREHADRLVLLGDILYHGPRNDLPEEYAPKAVAGMLNGQKEQILCIRGNCDADVDQMMLDFPILSDFAFLSVDGLRIYATHGHVFGPDHLPPLCPGDILLYGHTHIPSWEKRDGILCLNPGSLSIPKQNTPHGYMLLEHGSFTWKDLDGTVYHTLDLS